MISVNHVLPGKLIYRMLHEGILEYFLFNDLNSHFFLQDYSFF